jgi:hypothetical protein
MRKLLLDKIPGFWPTVFGSGPEEIQKSLQQDDLALIASLKSFTVERYQIQSATQGEPRSLRFTFEFAPNEFLHDTVLVKDFEYQPKEDGPGSLVSKPVAIKWKSKKQDLTHGLLDDATELYSAEGALRLKTGDRSVDIVDRESLWQYEKLREKLVKEDDEKRQPSFFQWFGFRGAVVPSDSKKADENGAADGEDDEEEDDDEMLEVEIFPAGEEVAIALAEEMWPDVMDYFMSSQEADEDFDGLEDPEEDEDDDSAPELVDDSATDTPELVEADDEEGDRPTKRQRRG